ncbi:MAG: hypothetical protein ACO1SV_08915 [Fimbriimonas sp.]
MNLPTIRPPRLLIAVALLPLSEPLAHAVALGEGSPALGGIAAAWIAITPVVRAAAFLLCAAAILILLNRMTSVEPFPHTRRWGLLQIAGVCSILSIASLDPAAARAAAKERALREETRILSAIDRYRNDKGEIPRRLEDLVPKYLSSPPDPKVAGTRVLYTPQPKPSLHFVMVTPCPGSRTPFTSFQGDGRSPMQYLKSRLLKSQ